MICWFSSFWHHFDLVKQVQFGGSGDFLQNAWEEWLAIYLTCWCILTTFSTAYILFIVCWFSSFWREFDLVNLVKQAASEYFLENARAEWPDLEHADVSWPPSEFIKYQKGFATRKTWTCTCDIRFRSTNSVHVTFAYTFRFCYTSRRERWQTGASVLANYTTTVHLTHSQTKVIVHCLMIF